MVSHISFLFLFWIEWQTHTHTSRQTRVKWKYNRIYKGFFFKSTDLYIDFIEIFFSLIKFNNVRAYFFHLYYFMILLNYFPFFLKFEYLMSNEKLNLSRKICHGFLKQNTRVSKSYCNITHSIWAVLTINSLWDASHDIYIFKNKKNNRYVWLE